MLTPGETVRSDVQCGLDGNETGLPELFDYMRTHLQKHLEADGLEFMESAEAIVRMKYAKAHSGGTERATRLCTGNANRI
jgi:hypothetical protein